MICESLPSPGKHSLSRLLRSALNDLTVLYDCSAVVNMEASDPQKPSLLEHHGGLQQWLLSKDGQKAITNMVKCLGHALRGEQWFGIDNFWHMHVKR